MMNRTTSGNHLGIKDNERLDLTPDEMKQVVQCVRDVKKGHTTALRLTCRKGVLVIEETKTRSIS